MAVTFVVGNAHRISDSLLAPGTTISASIANEFTEAVGKLYTSSLIALGLLLFVLTFVIIAAARLLLLRLERARSARMSGNLRTPPDHRRAWRWAPPGVATAARPGISGGDPLDAVFARSGRPVAGSVFTQTTPAPGSSGGLINAIYGSVVMTLLGRGRSARRSASSPPPTCPSTAAPRALSHRDPLHQRCAAERALDRHRPVRLHAGGGADGALLGHRRRDLARHHRHSGHGAHRRGHAAADSAEHAARLGRRSARSPGARSPASCIRRRAAAC